MGVLFKNLLVGSGYRQKSWDYLDHPPFSNNVYAGDNHHVQWEILPLFASANKVTGFFSGHAHGYERFFIQDKTFLVIDEFSRRNF